MRISDWSSEVCSSDLEKIDHIRHRRTQTRISKLAQGQQIVHFDAAQEATSSQEGSPAPAPIPRQQSDEKQAPQAVVNVEHEQKQDSDAQQKTEQQPVPEPKQVLATPQPVVTPTGTSTGPHRRRSSVRSDRTGPLTENNVLDFIYKASSRLEELDRTIDALVQKFQSVLRSEEHT